jgi:hypothetical protein
MKRTARVFGIALGLLALAVSARAQTNENDPVPYLLKEPSAFETGCFNGCACPVLSLPMRGSFLLLLEEQNLLFTTYAVKDVNWSTGTSTHPIHLTGSGRYRIGGEVALQQEIVLDLSLNGGPPRRYQSGLVSGGGEFPAIHIDAAANGFACYDTVLAIHAAPTSHVDVNPGPWLSFIGIRPNPFRGSTSFEILLPVLGAIEVSVFDTRGRLVRRIEGSNPETAYAQAFGWDGRDDAGRAVAPGVYIARFTADARTDVKLVVKVE